MEDIRLYDFKKSEKFSIENIRHLILMSEEFCKTSNMQISYETKSESLIMTIDKSSQVIYGEFVEMIDKDSVVVEYNIYPVVENLALFMDKRVVLSLVDLLLGGSGKIDSVDRELTEIDLELFRYLVDNLLKRIYVPYKYDKIEIVSIYTNTVQYQKLNNKSLIFNSFLNVSIENQSIGYMRFCIPYKSMEPVINDLVSSKIKSIDRLDNSGSDIFDNEIFDFVKNVDVDICATLGSTKVSIGDLVNLEKGDVILLDQKIVDDITVFVGDAEVYKAKTGILGIKKGVEITNIINRE